MHRFRDRQFWRLAFIAFGGVLWVTAAGIAIGQGGIFDQRVPPVTESQARVDLPDAARSGEPFHFTEERIPDDPGPLIEFGPYRLVPWGFVGNLHQESRVVPNGVQTADIEVLRRSSLYRDVPSDILPADMHLVSVDTGVDNSETTIHFLYESSVKGDTDRIEIWRMRPTVAPIDIDLKREDQGDWRTLFVDDRPTIIIETYIPIQTGDLSERQVLSRQIRMAHDDIDVLVMSSTYDTTILIDIARSLTP